MVEHFGGTGDEMRKNHAEYVLQQEDEDYSNHTYKREQELLEFVKRGDIQTVTHAFTRENFPEYPQLLGRSSKKNEEYMAVITISLVARAAVEGGVSSAESFQLADVYMKKIASLSDIRDIIEVRNDAVVSFTQLVKKRKSNKKTGIYIEECKKYIAANIFKKISPSLIAGAMNLNTVYLERIFKENEGTTITEYIQREKIGRARNLLIYSDRSILEISQYLGFSSQSYFGQIFRKETGWTPKQFREQNHMSDF